MAIPVRCAGCGSTMKVADQFAGKKGTCPKCGGAVQVPKIAEAIKPQQPAVKPSAPASFAPSSPAPLPSPVRVPLSSYRPAAGNKQSSPPPWFWVAGSGAVAVVILLLVGFVRNGGSGPSDTSPPIAATPKAARTDSGTVGPTEFGRAPGRPSSRSGLVPVAASVDLLSDRFQPKTAKTIEEVAEAVVKFEMPQANGEMITGTGFLIDSRGWVATNCHVASKATTAARVKLKSGRKIEIEGTIALEPERDLAIVKLRELPLEASILDIGYYGVPKIGTRIYAYGHPLNNEFSLVDGIVSRVLTTAEFADQQPAYSNVLSKMNAPADQLWIQTNATMSQGNSGGPLLDENCRVIGVITFANLEARFGFAGHVKFLKALADRASGEATPLPQPPDSPAPGPVPEKPREIVVSKEKMQQLCDAAAAFDWQPGNQDEYEKLADLALMMTTCKEPDQNVPFQLSDFADQLFEKMKAVSWSGKRAAAVNRYAKDRLSPNHGIAIAGTVVANIEDPLGKTIGILIHAPGVPDLFLVPFDINALIPFQGSQVLVFGVVLPQTKVAKLNDSETRKVRFIRSHFSLSI